MTSLPGAAAFREALAGSLAAVPPEARTAPPDGRVGAVLVLFAEWRAYRTDDAVYRVLARRWAKALAVLFAIGWMIASAGFGFYAANMGSYNATYGSLGAVIVLMTWLFLSAFLLLFGAHFSAVCARTPGK